MREALAHTSAPYACGALVGALLGLLVIAPALACSVAILLAVATGYAASWERAQPSNACALTPRRVITLVRALPHDSATVAAARGGDHFRGWDGNRYLLALIGDLLQELIYVQVAKASPKRKPQRPTPIPRPDASVPSTSGSEHGLRGQLQDMLRRKHNRKALS